MRLLGLLRDGRADRPKAGSVASRWVPCSTWSLGPFLIAIVGCAELLGYDEVSFEDGSGGAMYGNGGVSAAGGGSGESGAAGQSTAGGAPNGGGGAPSGGGTSDGGGALGGSGGASSGGTSPGGGSSAGSGAAPGGGGASSGGGGSAGAGATTGNHYETLTDPNATGNEAGGLIPVCCVPSATEKSEIDQVFSLLNQHRLANGKSALAYDTKLEAAIEGHAHHMATHSFWGHDAPESAVSSPWTRATSCGTSANGENLANGYTSATAVMDGWKGSPGHNANMLGNFSRAGIGKYASYWGQLFGS